MSVHIPKDVNLPSFLVVGTAKAGTTSIYHYLRQDHRLAIPVKETFFYSRSVFMQNHLPYPQQRPKTELILDEAEYLKHYRSLAGKMVGEIGTGYLYHHKTAIPEIRKYLGDQVKIIILLRDPVQRAFSSYQHFRKDLHETKPLEEALELESTRAAQGWDFMWQHRALGHYTEQVKAYLDVFDQVQIFFYEDLQKDPEQFMRQWYGFLGLKIPENIDYRKKYNTSGKVKSRSIQRFITHENALKKWLRPAFRFFFGKEKRAHIRKYVKTKNMGNKTALLSHQKENLEAYYKTETTQLKGLLGIPLPWDPTDERTSEHV